MIKRVKGGYKATSESGRPLSKKPKSKAGALRQLRAVEASKARRKKCSMSLFNPYKVDGVKYGTAQEAKAARRHRSEEQIKSGHGVKGFVGRALLRTLQRKGENAFEDKTLNNY